MTSQNALNAIALNSFSSREMKIGRRKDATIARKLEKSLIQLAEAADCVGCREGVRRRVTKRRPRTTSHYSSRASNRPQFIY